MQQGPPGIVIVAQPIEAATLRRLVCDGFGDMVKLVADVERGILAVGGELHADAEGLLLASGSRQHDLWGANYYPGRGDDCIEYTSLINISPSRGNPGMELADAALRQRVRQLVFALVGMGEEL